MWKNHSTVTFSSSNQKYPKKKMFGPTFKEVFFLNVCQMEILVTAYLPKKLLNK